MRHDEDQFVQAFVLGFLSLVKCLMRQVSEKKCVYFSSVAQQCTDLDLDFPSIFVVL